MMAIPLLLLLAVLGCSGSEAANGKRAPSADLEPVTDALCVTKGSLNDRAVEEPTMRGYARGASGDAAQLTFTYKGESFETRALAGGQDRRQIGLKLRAQDSCNVIYVMWRLDPVPKLDVSVKHNPGMKSHEQCGAGGYTKVKPYKKPYVQAFEFGRTHTLRAEIVGDELFAWIDGKLRWQGRLPESARKIAGPPGVRSDNVRFEIIELSAPRGSGEAPACKREPGD